MASRKPERPKKSPEGQADIAASVDQLARSQLELSARLTSDIIELRAQVRELERRLGASEQTAGEPRPDGSSPQADVTPASGQPKPATKAGLTTNELNSIRDEKRARVTKKKRHANGDEVEASDAAAGPKPPRRPTKRPPAEDAAR